jgi:hypothetical protein
LLHEIANIQIHNAIRIAITEKVLRLIIPRTPLV